MTDICEIRVNSGDYRPTEFDEKTGLPRHTMLPKEGTIALCCNSLKEYCPYAVEPKIDTEFVNFKQYICVWAYRKK